MASRTLLQRQEQQGPVKGVGNKTNVIRWQSENRSPLVGKRDRKKKEKKRRKQKSDIFIYPTNIYCTVYVLGKRGWAAG